MDEIRKKILETVVIEYQKKGLKFTMDDIAKELHISKKTIYKTYRDKEQMLDEMVDYVFNSIKETEARIMKNPMLSTDEKVKKILGALPDNYKSLDFRLLYQLAEKYPKVYKKINSRLESDWDNTIALIELGIKEGSIRNVSIPVVKLMFESTIEKFLSSDILIKMDMDYTQALSQMVDLLVYGMKTRN
ncbi:TetR/AcrR family transcriptional regulator [Butyrivibrio sp. NC3005]|uniref:TetR/AcrR family transcriptional regulator n=1 Tax=Butyrivibrio sp. NC3005 TaxID=1280685 RepID=UPI0003FADE78|nr:TetR/AcrR family transcriptional regulator [Butyrivibrio sp. NC3005]